MANAWGVTASWADDVEDHEAAAAVEPPNTDYPSLGEAVKMPAPQQKQKKKEKGQKLMLGEFLSSGGAPPRISDKDILMQLPKAPRDDRDPDSEDRSGMLGGGFKDYGGFRSGGGGGFAGGRREGDDGPQRRNRDDEYQSSRADDIDDWGTTKKFTPSDSRSGGRGGGFGSDRPMRPVGESDTVDDWGSTKKFEASSQRPGGFQDGPGGFRDGPRRGFEGQGPSRADEEDQWGKNRAFQPSTDPPGRGGPTSGRGFGFSSDRHAAPEEDRWARRGPPEDIQPAAATNGAPVERPRLKLQPRSVPLEGRGAADQPSQADQPTKSNPFGAARPREEVLKEKGVDTERSEGAACSEARLSKDESKVTGDKSSQDPSQDGKPVQQSREGRSARAGRGPPEPRAHSRETGAPFAGAPGKERW